MQHSSIKLFRLACFLSALAVGLNALGYHLLSKYLIAADLAIFETASRYLLIGSLWLLIFTRNRLHLSCKAMGLILTGLGLFCGSLFLYILLKARFLMMITPVGGVSLMVGFVWLGLSAKSEKT